VKVIAIAGGIAVAGAVTGLLIGILGDGSPSTFGGGAAVVDCPAGDHIDTYAEGSRVFAIETTD
jgi:hypothetical protein